MKKIFAVLIFLLMLSIKAYASEIYTIKDLAKMGIIANSSISKADFDKANKIMLDVHKKTLEGIKNGKGPFYAEIYDSKGNLVAASSNSVVEDKCCLYHAEVNTIKKASEILKKYNLAQDELIIYINAEPCIMCSGAIMWSGIKTVYFSVPSSEVEKITGFDEGYKPNWIQQFKKRGIVVYGNIEQNAGKRVLQDYVEQGHEIYKPR